VKYNPSKTITYSRTLQ